jgi:hypothetical protein
LSGRLDTLEADPTTQADVDNADSILQGQIDDLEERVGDGIDGVNIALKQGWDEFRLPAFVLVGTANHPEGLASLDGDYSVENVLNSIDGSYDYIAYDDGNNWHVFVPGEIEDDFTEFPTAANTPDYVFHIYMTETATLNIPAQVD